MFRTIYVNSKLLPYFPLWSHKFVFYVCESVCIIFSDSTDKVIANDIVFIIITFLF